MSIASLCRRLLGRAPDPTSTPPPMRAATPVPATGRVAPLPQPASLQAAATPRRRRAVKPVAIPPKLLARRLLRWCQIDEPLELLHEELLEFYQTMCALDGLVEQPWRDVGAELRRLTGGRKTYRWVLRDGERHRLRVYRIPPAPVAPVLRHTATLRRAA